MIVYVLSNPAMPGLVKIGRTEVEDVGARLAQLYTTGVPVPFKIEFACKVDNPDKVERALHKAFGPNRVNTKREFFRIEPDQAIAILQLLEVEDATAQVENQPSEIDAESLQAAETLRSRRPNFNFEEMAIPLGSILNSEDSDSTVKVIGPKKVLFGEEPLTLTAATRKILGIDYSVQPGPHWRFNGKLLSEIYEETYS